MITGKRPKRYNWLWTCIAVGAVILFARVAALRAQDTPPSQPTSARGPRLGEMTPLEAPPPSADVVSIGMYVTNVYDLDMSSNTYKLSGYVWWHWTGEGNPGDTMEFTNAVDSWDFTFEPLTDEPEQLADGSYYQSGYLEGRFYEAFDLADYPLDGQDLTVYVEDSVSPIGEVAFVPETESIGVSESLNIPGFHVVDLTVQSLVHNYGSQFGPFDSEDASNYSTLKFSVGLDRVHNLFLWKLMFPLLVVLITSCLALLLTPDRIDLRTAMPATALLTIVFLQQTAQAAIPELSILVLMDKIYVLAYAVVILTFARILWDDVQVDERDDENIAAIKRTDRLVLVALLVGFTVLIGILLGSVLL